MTETTKWDVRLMRLAKEIASHSKDPSTQCGAVIVDPLRRIVSTGYNGFARGVHDTEERLTNRDVKLRMVLHAEQNALLYAKTDLTGHTLYVYPIPPCAHCAAMIIQSGITRVVATYPASDRHLRWQGDWVLAKEMYDEAGVAVCYISLTQENN